MRQHADYCRKEGFDIIGMDKILGNLDAEFIFGYFTPESAFLEHDHKAFFVSFKLEWNF